MMKRVFYTIQQTLRWHQAVVRYLYPDSPWRCNQLTELDPQWLKQQEIRILVLDFDGVMATHGETVPLPAVEAWLKKCVLLYPPQQIYILSNKPLLERQHYFQQHFPGITFIISPFKKPYPQGLLQVIAHSGQPAHTVALVDDRLLTGVLAAQIAGTHAVYITHPYANFTKRPVIESFFAMLRSIEQLLLS